MMIMMIFHYYYDDYGLKWIPPPVFNPFQPPNPHPAWRWSARWVALDESSPVKWWSHAMTLGRTWETWETLQNLQKCQKCADQELKEWFLNVLTHSSAEALVLCWLPESTTCAGNNGKLFRYQKGNRKKQVHQCIAEIPLVELCHCLSYVMLYLSRWCSANLGKT